MLGFAHTWSSIYMFSGQNHSMHMALPCIQGELNMLHSGAGASVEKIGEAAACAVKRLHLDHRMVQVSCVESTHAVTWTPQQ